MNDQELNTDSCIYEDFMVMEKVLQAGQSCELPGLEGDVPAYRRGLALDDLRGPLQPKPFYDFQSAANKVNTDHKAIS